MERRLQKLLRPRFERKLYELGLNKKGYSFDNCHYWPDDSLVGGYMNEPNEDNGWLDILKSAIS